MKPVMQTRVGQDPDGPGNCFSACLASIMECDLADLPDEADIIVELKKEFAGKWETWPNRFRWGKSWERLWTKTQEALAARGLCMLEVKGPFESEPPPAYCIISGQSPRGLPHSCVGRGTDIIHDPHPEGGGVAAEDRTYIFFFVLDPTAVAICQLPPYEP